MSRIGDNPYRRVQAASSKGDSRQQPNRDQQGKGQNQGQGQGNGGGNNTPSEIHDKAAPSWGNNEATLSSQMLIKGRVGGKEQGNATVNIHHKTPDGNSKPVDSFQTTINPGGVVLDSWTVKKIDKAEGSVSFEIKTENSTYKGSDFTLKAPIKG